MNIPIEIIVAVMVVIFGAIGALIGIMIDAFRKNTEAVKGMGDAIVSIQMWITKKDTAEVFEEKECAAVHKSINEKFDEHGKILKDHEHRIKKIEK